MGWTNINMKKTLLLIYLFGGAFSCSKESSNNPSSTSSVEIKYEITSNTTIISPSSAIYTTTAQNVTIDNNVSGTTWSKTVKLNKGTLVQFETMLTLSGANKSSTATIYANGIKKVSSNSAGNTVNNTTIAGTALQYVIE
jgi:hypothetical protein